MTPSETTVLRGLRERGFAVCVFTPDEVGESDTEAVEDAMCEGGWQQINFDNPEAPSA